MKSICSKHDFSFIDQSNGWTLPNGDLDPSLFFRDSLHLTEEGNFKLAKLIINSIALTNDICFSSNSGKRNSYSDTCENKALSPPVHTHKFKHSPYLNNCNRDLCETHGSNYVSSMSKPVSTKTVCKSVSLVSCNKVSSR